jgi:sterol desaturase/sphingolipid hydroxylase (fatty acid hydroxylase superfamily)
VLVNTVVSLLVLAAVLVPLERLFALRREQRVLRPGWRTDVVHFLVNPLLRTAGTIVIAGPFFLLASVATPESWKGAVRSQPPALQLVEALAIVIVGAYWAHRLSHRIPFLWRFHRVHHSSEQLDWLAAGHLHPLDTAFSVVLPGVPLVLLGFTRATFGISLTVLTLLAIVDHANLRFRFGPLRWVLPNPQWHHWHHSNEPEARDKNFSGIAVVDRVFGTAYLPDGRFPTAWPGRYGINEPMPAGYLGQLASPFTRRRPSEARERAGAASGP